MLFVPFARSPAQDEGGAAGPPRAAADDVLIVTDGDDVGRFPDIYDINQPFVIQIMCPLVSSPVPRASVPGEGAVVEELVPVVGRRGRGQSVVAARVGALAAVLLLELLARRDGHPLRLRKKDWKSN